MGDHRLPDQVKRGGTFNPEDLDTVRKLKDALVELPSYKFRFLDNHGTLERDLGDLHTDLIFNLCDEGWNNDPFKELHVPALMEVLGIGYTGAGPQALAACYDKGLVRAVAQGLDVPVPLESYVRPGDQGATLPSVFPALLKPNQGDSSQGITKDAVVNNEKALLDYLDRLRAEFPKRGVLVQEFLTGAEYSVGLVGNPDQGLRALPILEVDYSRLDEKLPKILGYESKWEPESPYWTQIKYREATLPDHKQQQMIDSSSRLFERLGCRDYARFDFRADAKGEIKLLEVNPNPGWCWDGKMNIMAGFQGMRYSEFLGQILQAAVERLGITAKPAAPAAAGQRQRQRAPGGGGVGWVERSADPTPSNETIEICVGSSLTLDPTYAIFAGPEPGEKSTVKITGYQATTLNVPEDDPLANMPEEAGRTRPIVILRLRTDSGIEGIGVTLCGGRMTRQPAHRGRGAGRADGRRGSAADRGDHRQAARAAPAMPAGRAASSRWRSRRSTSRCGTSRARRWTSRCGSCWAAIATASPTYASGSLRRGLTRRPGAAGGAHRWCRRASREMKTQMALPGNPPPAEEVRRVRVVREAIGPDIKLMCDINQRWRPEQAIDIGSRVEDVGLFWLEDVTTADDYRASRGSPRR